MESNYVPTWDDLTTELDDIRAELSTIVGSWLPVLTEPGDHAHLSGMIAAYRLVIQTLVARIATIRHSINSSDPVPRFGCENGPRQMSLADELDLYTWITVRHEQTENVRKRVSDQSDRRPRKDWSQQVQR